MRIRFLSVLALAMACGAAAYGSTQPEAGTAKFDYFSYEGDDDYYRANPLTEPGQYFNPVISGWASDPSLCKADDGYWLVTSTFGYFPGVPLYHSDDLLTWTLEGNVLDRQEQLPWLEGLSIDKGGVYAPAISYNPHNKTYYMITTCVMNGKGKDKSSVNFYVTAPHPRGPWSNPVILEDVHGIDPSFFFDEDGSAYIVHKSDEHSPVKWSNHRALSIIRFDPQTGKTVGKAEKFREEGVGPEERLERDEGPHIYKINGHYYLLAAEGGTNWVHSEVCYRADSVMGPYRRWSRNPMLTQRLLKPYRKLPVTSTGHVDMIQAPGGEWCAVFLGCRPWNDGEDHLGRETFLMPVKWSADGFPYITQAIDTVGLRLSLPGATTMQRPGQAGNFGYMDRFDGPKPGPEWLSLWGWPADYMKTGDGLSLKCAPVNSYSGKTPAYLGRRMQHHKFTAETEVRFRPGANEAAGLLMVKNEGRQLFMAVRPWRVDLLQPGKGGGRVTASVPVTTDGSPIGLRVVSDGDTYSFYVRPAGETEWKELAKDVDAGHIATQRGGFTGSTIGLYATSSL